MGYGSTPYRDYNGRRYTVYYMRGIYRDWAVGMSKPPQYAGIGDNSAHEVNAYGCETVGDGSGSLIVNAFAQYLHVLQNWAPPVGTSYQSGSWLASPTFPDDATVPMFDAASFTAAQAQSAIYVSSGTGGGFRGDFGIGAPECQQGSGTRETEGIRISRIELLARLNQSFGCQSGFSKTSQYMVTMLNTNSGTITLQPALTWIHDIFSNTFEVESRLSEIYTNLPFRHTRDFPKRDLGWRSGEDTTAGLAVDDPAAATINGVVTYAPEVDLWMLRGKNRSSDYSNYQQGTDTAAAVLELLRRRYAYMQHLPTLQTGPGGFNYELGQTVPVTHYEGVGGSGWTDEPIRIERIEVDPTDYTTTIEGYDITPIV
jgi:hypothetical protein